jgi:hypothetical protein
LNIFFIATNISIDLSTFKTFIMKNRFNDIYLTYTNHFELLNRRLIR